MDEEYKSIGGIANYYGGPHVKEGADKYYWSIENWCGHNWEEITKKLYDALIEWEDAK